MPPSGMSTILVVEDDALVRMHGIDLLEEAGFDVLEACNADDAMIILDGLDDVHLVFSDVDMPGTMDGLALVRLVYARWPHIHLLLTSGHHHLDQSDLPRAGQFMRKPWPNGELVARVSALLHI